MKIAERGGPYDVATDELRQRFNADGCVLIVFGGSEGTGVSMNMMEDLKVHLPMLFQGMVREVEAALAGEHDVVFCPVCHAPLDVEVAGVVKCPECRHFLKVEKVAHRHGDIPQQ